MANAYALIKGLHVSLVLISGALFLLRGLIALPRPRWARARWLRILSQVIDTGLLLAALGLLFILALNPLSTPWLLTKLLLLLAYIGAGYFALDPATPFRRRLVCFVAAVLCFLAMLSVAQHHHPLGALGRLL
ncbi:MAG: SirB2 family protein [Pigmentiphaga sp.]